jgi:hypothetical protein
MLRSIHRLPFAVAFVLVVTTSGLLYPEVASAAAGDTLDQSQTAQNTWGMIGSGAGTGEVFTAGQSGYLDRVSLYVGQYAANPAATTVSVSIQTVTNDGVPSGTVIGTGFIRADDIPASGGWVDADIDGAFVTAGTKYALILSTMDGIALWYMESGDVKPYPSGYGVSNAAGVWEKILTNQDWTFKTYVALDALDQNQSDTTGTGLGTRALGTTPVGQTFTVGLYGLLDRVRVFLTNSSASPGPIMVTILKVTSTGLPNIGSQVASATISAEAIPKPGYRGWATATIAPFVVTPGTTYVVLLSTTVSGPQWVLVSDVYSGGTGVIKNGTAWTTASYDFAFQSYVLPPILDQAQTQWSSYSLLRFGWPVGQYFTAHVSGLLDRVSVVLDNGYMYGSGPDISVAIYFLEGLMGSGTIPYTSVPFWFNGSTPPWLNAGFTGVAVRAGMQYLLTLQEDPSYGNMEWYYGGNYYAGGSAFMGQQDQPAYDMAFKTYVLPIPTRAIVPGPGGITPCLNGVCLAASGGFTPADLTDGVTSHFQFQERPDRTVQAVLNFNDPRPDGIVLHGCTTESAACTLTVTMLSCTDTHSVTVGGTYTPRGGTSTYYRLIVSSASDGPGTFKLSAAGYTFTLTLDGIANVTCPRTSTP